MSCPACEQSRLAGKRFCSQCGERLIGETPEAAQEPAAKPEAAPSQWKQGMPRPEQTSAQRSDAPTSDAKGEPTKPSQWKDSAPASPESTPKKKRSAATIAVITGVLVIAAAAGLYFSGALRGRGSDAPQNTSAAQTQKQEQTKPKGVYTMGETQLCDNDDMRVTVTKVSENPYTVSVKLRLENVSDKVCVMRVQPSAINDCDMESFLVAGDTKLAGGESTGITIKIDKTLLHRFGMEQIDKLTFHIGARDSYESTEIRGETYVDVYPTGMSESAFSASKAVHFDTQETIYQKDGLTAWLAEPEAHEGLINAYTIILGAENAGGSDLLLRMEDIQVNGEAYNYPFETISRSGRTAYLDVWMMGEELARMGIATKEVETITFTFAVCDAKTMERIDSISYTYTP